MIPVYTIPEFEKSLVRLSKKYRSDVIIALEGEIVLLIDIYDKNEFSTVNKKILQKRIADFISKL